MPVSFSDAVADAIVGSACALLAVSDDATRWINSLYGADADFGNIARSLRKQICNESAPTGDYGSSPPYEGLQCDCARYQFEIVYSFTSGGTTQETSILFAGRGPITNITVDVPSFQTTSVRILVDCKGGTFNNAGAYGSCGAATQVGTLTNQGGEKTAANFIRIQNLVAPDGDNCGSLPPPPIGTYNDFTETVNITYEDNTQITINEDVDTTIFAPFIGIGGAIFAPFTVSGNDFNLVGTLQLKPEIKVELSADLPDIGFGDRENPSPSPLPGVETPTNPRDSRRIIGAVVTATVIDESRFTQILQGTNPDIFVPRLGNISFYVATEQGDAWTADQPIKNLRQFIATPTPIGAVDVAATAEPNVTLDVKPVYADLRGLSA